MPTLFKFPLTLGVALFWLLALFLGLILGILGHLLRRVGWWLTVAAFWLTDSMKVAGVWADNR